MTGLIFMLLWQFHAALNMTITAALLRPHLLFRLCTVSQSAPEAIWI